MNLLASLLIHSAPFALTEQHVRKIRDPDMPRKSDAQQKPMPPKRSDDYGQVKPKVLTHLKTVQSAEPRQIAIALAMHPDSVRRALRALVKEEKIICVREACSGKWRRPALWRVADNEHI